MRIGINGRFLRYPATGTGQHTLHLLTALAERRDSDTYHLLGPGPRVHLHSPAAVAAAAAHLAATRTHSAAVERVQRLWWEQVQIVAAARAQSVALLHSPYFSAPLMAPAPMVVTIHDVVTLLLPEYRERWINRLYTSIVALAARKAAAIIAVSETTKRDVSRVLGIAPDRIRVIGNAVDAQFRPVEDRQCLDALRARYGLPPQFILYLGGFDVRKNLARLLEAYARMSPALRAAYPLVIAGRAFLLGHPLYPDPHSAVERLGLDDAVRFVGEIAQEDTPALYSAATLLAWPSLYEGFGLPVLEAMACGTPVVTSSTSSLPEVAGDAARLVDPRDVDAMATAITTLLEDSDARAQLVERGLRRAAEFTWDRVAATTVDVYHSVLSRTS